MLDGRDLGYQEHRSNTCCKTTLLANKFLKCCQFPCQRRQRMRDFNLSVRDLYSSFSEDKFDNVLQTIMRDVCPEDGLKPHNVMCSWRLVWDEFPEGLLGVVALRFACDEFEGVRFGVVAFDVCKCAAEDCVSPLSRRWHALRRLEAHCRRSLLVSSAPAILSREKSEHQQRLLGYVVVARTYSWVTKTFIKWTFTIIKWPASWNDLWPSKDGTYASRNGTRLVKPKDLHKMTLDYQTMARYAWRNGAPLANHSTFIKWIPTNNSQHGMKMQLMAH